MLGTFSAKTLRLLSPLSGLIYTFMAISYAHKQICGRDSFAAAAAALWRHSKQTNISDNKLLLLRKVEHDRTGLK